MSKALSSRRVKAREAAKQKRIETRERERILLELVAAGLPYVEIADQAGVSVSAIKRQVQRALRQRPPEPAETFVALQRQRLDKALQCTDVALERGELRAVSALVALLPQIERYWGLQTSLRAARETDAAAQVSPPKTLESLPTETVLPPLGAEPARLR